VTLLTKKIASVFIVAKNLFYRVGSRILDWEQLMNLQQTN